jgi:TetR/AcrR family transcriptional regulator
MATKPKSLGTRGQPEQTRAAILKAAIREFAGEGAAGARTDAIARAAKVNKALLYYYFKDKETLYGAALDFVFAGLTERVSEVLERNLSPAGKIYEFVGAHFDYIASNPAFPRMVHQEMMRAGRTGSPHLKRIVERYLRPTFGRLRGVIEEGIARGEIRRLDPAQLVPSLIGLNIFYFSAAPVMRLMTGEDPFSPEHIRQRRAAVLDFVSAAVFTREPGKEAGR